MAVYTKINKKDLLSINKKFADKKFINFKVLNKVLKILITC